MHPQLLEKLPARIGVDSECAACEFLEMRNHVRLAASDDDDGGRSRYVEVVVHRDACGDRFHVQCARGTIEVSYEENELSLMSCFSSIVQRAKGEGIAMFVVDR